MFAAFVAMAVMLGIATGQRNSAREELRVAVALYQGVLAGRRCAAEPLTDAKPIKPQGLHL